MPQEDVLINFEVDYSQLTAAQEQLAKAGKIDNKGFQDIQKAIDTTATDTKGLIKQFKDVATASIKMGKTVEDSFGAGIQDALDEAGVSMDEFSKALKDANKPAGTLKKELLALKEAMARMKVEGKDTGKEFEALRSRAGKLQDAIADANAEIKNAGSDTRNIDNVVGSISALAGGFAAAQGAAALFGDENEDLQRTLVKVTGAMAIAQGLQQLLNATQKEGALIKLKDSIATGAQSAAQAIYSAAVGTSTGALKAFRIALLATGIGAVIALLVLGAQALGVFESSTSNAADEQERLSKAIEGTNIAIQEQVDSINSTAQTNIKRAKIAGKGEAELTKIARDAILERIKFYSAEGKARELMLNIPDQIEQGKVQIQIFQELNKAREELRQFDLDQEVKAAEKRLDAIKKAQEKLKKIQEDAEKERLKQAEQTNQNFITSVIKRANDELEQEYIHYTNQNELDAQTYDNKKALADEWDKLHKEFQVSLVETSDAAAKKMIDDDNKLTANRIKNIKTTIAVAQQVADFYQHLSDLATQQEREKIQEQRNQIDALEKAGAISKRDADLRRQQTEIAEKRAKQNQAKREKDAAVFRALIAIPQAFLQGLSQGGIYLAAVYAALAAAEAALVIARPIPKFAKGKKDGYEGPGIVGDQGTELVERNGRMFLYTKPTQTYLGAKDKVYTATETKNILHNSNISTTIQHPKTERFDYARLGRAIAKDNVNINIDKDFISEAVNNGLMKNNYYRNRYQFKKS